MRKRTEIELAGIALLAFIVGSTIGLTELNVRDGGRQAPVATVTRTVPGTPFCRVAAAEVLPAADRRMLASRRFALGHDPRSLQTFVLRWQGHAFLLGLDCEVR